MVRSKSLVCLLAVLFAGVHAGAQQITGSIRGTVQDPSSAFVQSASVSARQTETGLTRTAITDPSGAYVLLELPVGHYELQVEAKGFQKYIQQGITLNVNETATIPVHLAVGAESQVLEVNADAQLIQGTVTSLGKTVSEREVLDLPLNGRNFTQLGLLQPGVVPLTPGLAEAGGSLRAGQAYAVNGQRPESNNFLIDGANNFNGVDGGFVLKPPVDAITEFRILTHNASAEFGQSLGSTTNIITRSGTNRFHGALWEFLRNDIFDATNYFRGQNRASETEPVRRDVWWTHPQRQDFLLRILRGLPKPPGRNGLVNRAFRWLSARVISRPFALRASPAGFCNNQNHQLFNVFLNQPYPNNQYPVATQTNPVSQNLLQFFPLPNNGTNVFTSTQVVRQDSNQGGVKVDHYLTASDILNFRYGIIDGSQFNPIPTSGASVPGFPVGQDQRAQNFVVQETHTFSPSLIGVFRASYLRNKFLFGQHINPTTPASLGFQYTPSLEAAVGPPSIQVAGYTTIGNPITGPRNTFENAFDYSRLFELGARPSRTQIRRWIPAPAGQRAAGHCHQRLLCFRAFSSRARCVCQLPVWPAGRLSARPG